MRASLLLVGQVCTDAVDHHHDQSAIIHIEPVRTADEFVFAVPCRLYPVCRTCRQIPWKMTQLERHLTEASGRVCAIGRGNRAPRPHCVAGHVGLELRNVDANYPFERSHKFAGIQPNSGHGDHSRLSCSAGIRWTFRAKRACGVITDAEPDRRRRC